MSDVSLAGAFLAGLVSFLSPCVLPLVPGYISMLSGIGMEQLRKGELPRSGLFGSSLAFVAGFSAVFIFFGASANAVGIIFRPKRKLSAAKQKLSGAHCGRVDFAFRASSFGIADQANVKNGTDHRDGFGCSRSYLFVAAWTTFRGVWSDPLFFVVANRFFWSVDGALAKSRCADTKQNWAAWRVERVFVGIRFRIWLDPVHRANSCDGSRARGGQRHDCSGNFAVGGLLRGPGGAVSADGAGDRTVSAFLSEFS